MKLSKCFHYFFQINRCVDERLKNVAWKHDTETKNIEGKGYNLQSKFSHRIERSVGHLSYHFITTPGIGIPTFNKNTLLSNVWYKY